MKTKIKNKSKILEAVYETMNDFHASGIIDDEKMQQYKEMCLEPEPIKLDQDILDYLNQKCNFDSEKMSALINDWLRKDIEIARSVA